VSFASDEALPAIELFDRATFAAVEHLVDAGVLQFTAAATTVLHGSPVRGVEPEDAARLRRQARSRELCDQAERKGRMASVLAAGGFPIEALAPLREALEIALHAQVFAAGEAEDLPVGGADAAAPSASWIKTNLPLYEALDPAIVKLLAKLRGDPESLLGLTAVEARGCVADGQRLIGRIRRSGQAAAP
jgi:hypothetical protein